MLLKYSHMILLGVLVCTLSCISKKKVINDDFATDAADATETAATSDQGFSDEELNLDPTPVNKGSAKNSPDVSDDELSLEKELQGVATDKNEKPADPIAEAKPLVPVVAESKPADIPAAAIQPPPPEAIPAPVIVDQPPTLPVATKSAIVKDIQFKANDSGGALMIQADQPLEYTTQMNSATNQMVIEIQNVQVPNKFKRPLNTKDMTSSMGHIDIYQKSKSNIARFVIQMRPNSEQPLIQPEGASLMVIGSVIGPMASSKTTRVNGSAQSDFKIKNDASENVEINSDLSSESIMNTTDMDEYLANNTKFYGKKISIETTDVHIKDVLKFIAEESGVNMIFDDSINGNISLKLRKVPWDQAFVLVLKSKGLSYRRQGTVLRIATNETLVKEEKIAIELKESKMSVEPMIVKNFSINYADITELEKKLKEYIASDDIGARTKGRITADKRTNMLIVTETANKLKQVEALIRALDTQPQQVMIEARVIEASELFNKSIGVDWGLNRGIAFGAARTSTAIDPQPIQISPQFGYTAPQSAAGNLKTSLWLGKLGALGDLDVQLALSESEEKIKILSTPRVTVLTNTQATINQSFKVAQGSTTTTNNSITVTEPKYVDVGVKLNVTPQISNLGTVRMLIDVTRTGMQGGATNSRDMKTEVIVRSGDTTVIGGVLQSDVSVIKNGVPGLKDIPILGTLFRGQADGHTKTELMVFVTPKILAPVIPTLNSAEAIKEPSTNQIK